MTYDSTLSNLDEKAACIRLFDALAGHNLLLDANPPLFTILAATPERLRDVGMTKEGVIGKPLFEAHPGNTRDPTDNGVSNLRSSLDHVLRYKEVHHLPVQRYDLPDENGGFSEKYWKASNRPVLNEKGEVAYIIHTAEEITTQIKAAQREIQITEHVLARRKLEENEVELQKRVTERTAALEEQKIFISSILEATFDGIYALKANRNAEGKIFDFQYLFANNNIAKLLHLDTNEVIGSSMLTLLPENKDNGFFDLFCKLLETGETFYGETHFVTRDIDNWYEYVIVPIDKETVVISTKDITENKSAMLRIEEQRNLLDSILKNSSNGISVSKVIRNDSGAVIDALTILANDAAVKYIGLPKEIYLSKRATEIEPNIIQTPYYQACIQTLDTGVPFMMQYQMEATNRWLELTVSKLDEDRLIHVFTDVTPIKEAQLQLEKTVDDLKRSNQNLEEFAYAASHDLKEPMRKIHLYSGRLKTSLQENLSPENSAMFDRITTAANRMNTLIDDLLMYSHVSLGAPLMETIDLNQKLSRVLEDLELEIEEQKAVITVDPLPTIKGHRRQLQQLFQNLIGNGIKYHKPGVRPEVHIRCRKPGATEAIPVTTAKPIEDYYLLEISDNGIGFEGRDADRIFNVFTRLHGQTEFKGSGVGLSIAKKVVENHGGYIWAKSEPGKGSTFSVLLPSGD